jgi:hypothetical protein
VAGEEEGTGEAEGTDESQSEEKTGPPTIEEALAKAREVLADKGTMMAMVDDKEEEDDAGSEGESEAEEEEGGEEEAEEEGDQDAEGEEGETDAEGDAGDADDEVEGEEEAEDEEAKDEPITVSVPGRHPNSEDIELVVEDKEIAERIAHLKSGFMRGEEVREREVAMGASEDAMAALSEEFAVDPAGFVMQYTENKEELSQVALALLTLPEVWDSVSGQVDKLFSDTGELRTLRAEIKAGRLEAKDKLTKRSAIRKENAESGRKMADAIDLMVPDSIDGTRREQLITDLTRDTTDHITRNKLEKLDVKDLVPILAARLETNGIDPLDARKAVQDGSRSRGKITTKKRPEKKPKSGKELARASAKRKSVAAAPGAGKKAAPTQPTKLPAGMTIKESIALARKKGLAAFLPDK